ncbi:MAG: DUF4251 domain-containing protein [Bacteroidaceae bacterium]|nr:DUF4251 domain-containing protein [Bacteroidaceae bacterium]MBR3897353.1 DUF4251 domain-containing protein [Bacteroidaceae bacterium]
MKRILCIAACISMLCGGVMMAQSTRQERREAWKEARAIRRAEAKQWEAIEDSAAFQKALDALKAGSWVMEADNVIFRNGMLRYVSSNTNYVAVQNGEGTVQTAFNNFIYSPNGLGGVTVQGNVSDQQISRDKHGNAFMNFSIFGGAISATLNLTLTVGTNEASIYISPNFNGNTLTMNGTLVPYDEATVFEGISSW